MPTNTVWLAGCKPLADAVMVADPIATPVILGLDPMRPCAINTAGAIVNFEGSLLASDMNRPPDGAGRAKVTGKTTVSPG